MSVYRPTYTDPKTKEQCESSVWWYEFTFSGRRIRESTKTKRRTIAVQAEKRRRLELERALAGLPVEESGNRIRRVKDVIGSYQQGYSSNHRESSEASMKSALKNVERHLGTCLLPDLTEERMRSYMTARRKERASGRSVNYELGELSRAIGHSWKSLWPRLRKMEERSDAGRALSPEEKQRLLRAVDESPSVNLKVLVRAALFTGTRAGELTSLRWEQVDFGDRTITIGKAKTRAGTGRVIPMNAELLAVMANHATWYTEAFGATDPGHCVFPFGSPRPFDPARPTVEIKTAWGTARKAAKVDCRWHDLRHTACSDMNEAGVSEAQQLAIFGWSSRKTIERYSHARLESKRAAVEALTLKCSKEPLEEPASDGVPKESPKETDSGRRT